MRTPIKFTREELVEMRKDINYLNKHGQWESKIPDWANKIDKEVYNGKGSVIHWCYYALERIADDWEELMQARATLDKEKQC